MFISNSYVNFIKISKYFFNFLLSEKLFYVNFTNSIFQLGTIESNFFLNSEEIFIKLKLVLKFWTKNSIILCIQVICKVQYY